MFQLFWNTIHAECEVGIHFIYVFIHIIYMYLYPIQTIKQSIRKSIHLSVKLNPGLIQLFRQSDM